MLNSHAVNAQRKVIDVRRTNKNPFRELSAKFDSDKESCERTKYFKAAADRELKIFARKQCDS